MAYFISSKKNSVESSKSKAKGLLERLYVYKYLIIKFKDYISKFFKIKKSFKYNKMKIILIYPPTGWFSDYNTPTGLLYIGTVLRNEGHEVSLVDCSIEPKYNEILEEEIKNADILGVYAMSVHIKYLLPLLRRLKKINNSILFIWGGPHAMIFHEQTAKSALADIVCKGEGEEVMIEIVKGIESNNLNLHNIKGITFKEKGTIHTTPYREYIDMDTLPILDWSLLKQEVMKIVSNSVCRVQASRGCPYPCTFCINLLTYNRKMRYRDPNSILEEIDYLIKTYNIKRVGFRDEIFISNRDQVKAIAQGLIDRNLKITWIGNPRVEYLRERYLDDDFLRLLVKSGCNKLQTGGESGSERILRFLRKGIKVKDILNFTIRCKKFNIKPLIAFMTSIPTETRKEQKETIKLIRDILYICPEAFINGPANFRPYPGGELYEFCVKNYNLKMPRTLEEWANIEMLGGAKLPWIRKLYLSLFLWMSIKAATFNKTIIFNIFKKKSYKYFGFYIFSIISKIRLRYLFYKFPIEFFLLHIYYKYLIKSLPDYS